MPFTISSRLVPNRPAVPSNVQSSASSSPNVVTSPPLNESIARRYFATNVVESAATRMPTLCCDRQRTVRRADLRQPSSNSDGPATTAHVDQRCRDGTGRVLVEDMATRWRSGHDAAVDRPDEIAVAVMCARDACERLVGLIGDGTGWANERADPELALITITKDDDRGHATWVRHAALDLLMAARAVLAPFPDEASGADDTGEPETVTAGSSSASGSTTADGRRPRRDASPMHGAVAASGPALDVDGDEGTSSVVATYRHSDDRRRGPFLCPFDRIA